MRSMRSKRLKKFSILCCLLAAAILAAGVSVFAAEPGAGTAVLDGGRRYKTSASGSESPVYKVCFTNNKGTSASAMYTSLDTEAVKNTRVILPEVPKISGYQSLGWTTAKGGRSPLYKAGSQVKIKKNTKFYAVRRKSRYYTVQFFREDGKTNSAYRKLTKTVEEGTVIIFPAVPTRTGYTNLGWAAAAGASEPLKTEGSKVTIKKNRNFYAVQRAKPSIILCKNNGDSYKTIAVTKGEPYVLPCMCNADGYTFMGWSKKPNQTKNADYEAGEALQVTAPTRLYAVMFDRSAEPDLAKVSNLNTDKYSRLIFVGDSRTFLLEKVMSGMGPAENVSYVSQSGAGLDWFKKKGYPALIGKLEETGRSEKPVAVVFNWGVNDPDNAGGYISYMQEIAQELKKRGCVLFYMSVNPINSRMNELNGYRVHKEEDIRSFNKTIRLGLCMSGDYTYIDTYYYLMTTGYGTVAVRGVDDGLHYTAKTFKRIYEYCMEGVNNGCRA